MRAIAIVNAARARPKLRTALDRVLPKRVFYTQTLDEARSVVREEIKRGVDLVVLGGGDGTFVMTLALIAEACRGEGRPEPAIGMLRMGSGNALAATLGATDDPAADLARLVRGDAVWKSRPLIDVVGVRAPFVGMGLDAQLLEDNAMMNRIVDRIPVARGLLGGASRYALSVTLRSLPRLFTTSRARVRVINRGSACELNRRGETIAEFADDTELWVGDCTLVAASTIPYFGFGLRMFPFAETREDRFHLRCGDPGILEVLRSGPVTFRREYFSERVRDFLCDRVTLEVLDGESVAFECGGELVERRSTVDVALSRPVALAEFR